MYFFIRDMVYVSRENGTMSVGVSELQKEWLEKGKIGVKVVKAFESVAPGLVIEYVVI